MAKYLQKWWTSQFSLIGLIATQQSHKIQVSRWLKNNKIKTQQQILSKEAFIENKKKCEHDAIRNFILFFSSAATKWE